MANTILRPIVSRIDRQPIESIEGTSTIFIIAKKESHKDALVVLSDALKNARFPIGEFKTHAFGDDEIEIEASLSSVSLEPKDLDDLVDQLNKHDSINKAFWSPTIAE